MTKKNNKNNRASKQVYVTTNKWKYIYKYIIHIVKNRIATNNINKFINKQTKTYVSSKWINYFKEK